MKEKINQTIIESIFIVGMTLAVVVTIIMFIPTLIWGIFNDLTLSEICEAYWIDGVKNTIIENWNELRGL